MRASKPSSSEGNWGGSGCEVVWLESKDAGAGLSARVASKPDPSCAHWLPNLERPTGHNRVVVPGLIYTAGGPGKGCDDIMSNKVYWLRPV